MNENRKGKITLGCAACVWSFGVTSPMWLILLFALLAAREMPVWAWALYWAYVPAHLLGVLFVALARTIAEAG